MKFLFIDTETGGTDAERNSILSVGLAVISSSGLEGELEIAVMEPELSVTEKALKINRINLDEHVKIATDPSTAVEKILAFAGKWPDLLSDREKIILFGHNVIFDIEFLKRLFKFTGHEYSDVFSHRIVDTSSILRFLHLKGVFKEDISNLDAALDHFGINEFPRHQALKDAVLTAKLFMKLLDV
ncbi:MAG: 3'-5' exonuclease [Spirochaetes bacterium]|nr:3'-5' exonuclease [Spirochaetota bacterium]